jgi:uncharacterized protein with FMN-binding domain
MDPITQNQKTGKKGIIAGIVALLLVVGGAFAFMKSSSTQSPVATVPTDTTTDPTQAQNLATTPAITNAKYKDGTYTAVGNYQSPGGTESIQLTLVLKDDVVTDATVVSIKAQRSQSREFQDQFISGFKQYVVGKNISDVSVTKVSGSSLTPIGFMDALAQIKSQAQA